MLLSHKTVNATQLDAAYATHMVLHSRYRISIERFHNLRFDGSVLGHAIPSEPSERNWLIVPLEGEVVIGAGGREVALSAGECLVELNHRTDYLRYPPAVNLTLEWEPGFLGSRLLDPGDGIRFSQRNLRRLQRAAAPLQRDDVSNCEASRCIRELVALLRAEGLPFDEAALEDVAEEVPEWMRAISGALDHSLSDLARSSVLDLQGILGWSSATVRRRLSEFRTHFSYKTIRFREILHLRRLVTGAALLGATASTTETVASILGYNSPNAFYDALAHADLPSPASIREAARRLS